MNAEAALMFVDDSHDDRRERRPADSAYGTGKVIAAVVRAGGQFSFVLTKSPSVKRAISSITDSAWTPVHYPRCGHRPGHR